MGLSITACNDGKLFQPTVITELWFDGLNQEHKKYDTTTVRLNTGQIFYLNNTKE